MGNSNAMLTGNTLNFNLRLFLEPKLGQIIHQIFKITIRKQNKKLVVRYHLNRYLIGGISTIIYLASRLFKESEVIPGFCCCRQRCSEHASCARGWVCLCAAHSRLAHSWGKEGITRSAETF